VSDVLAKIDAAHPDLTNVISINDPSSVGGLLLPKPLVDDKISLHAHEESAIRSVVKLLTDEGPSKVVGCIYDQPLGASFVAYAVAGSFLSRHGVEQAYLIRPFTMLTESYLSETANEVRPEQAYESGLSMLAARLNVEMGKSQTARNILRRLEETRSVLFVLHAELIPQSGAGARNTMQELVKCAISSGPRNYGCPAPICLVGSIKPRFKSVDIGGELRRAASTQAANGVDATESRFNFFRAEWKRFCEFRGHPLPDDVGARLKRARWYYESLDGQDVWPVSIRMRSFLSSNYEVYAYFDPTAGWNRLASWPVTGLPPDIRLHLDEIVIHASSLPSDSRQPALRALKWVSTSLYWLTDSAVRDFNAHFKKFAKMEAFTKTVVEQTAFFRVQRSPGDVGNVYRADLTLKAVVQQRWMSLESGKVERAKAHFIVAKRLFAARDDKATLATEFPLTPHWGRSRIHLVAETLRHLMRACESAEKQPPRGGDFSPFPNWVDRKFPAPPSNTFKACDPYETVNFCFGILFWKELNGNNDHGGANYHNRKLARQHGLYSLTAELLQLMSLDGKLGEPHWALHPEHVVRYLREVAYAQLDLGKLLDAEKNFRRLIKNADNRKESFEKIHYQLDLAIVMAAKNDLGSAADIIECADVSFAVASQELEAGNAKDIPCYKDDPIGSGLVKSEKERIKSLDARIRIRRAHICYLQGKFSEALTLYQGLRSGAMTREVAHIYIATLGAIGGAENLQEALKEAGRQHVITSSKGSHHEALGFRIAKAHALRKTSSAFAELAESELDLVYQDILESGCSERTYLAFLLEAGRTVASLTRHGRAYSGYLRPCYERALSGGYLRVADTARRHAISSLHALRQNIIELGDDNKWTQLLKKELEGQGFVVPKRGHKETDPKYSYDVYGTTAWLSRLSTEAQIANELRCLEASSIADNLPGRAAAE
jgi:hypothetical protein